MFTPPSLEESARMEREAALSEGGSPLDLEAARLTARLTEEGRALPEDVEAVNAAKLKLKRLNKVEETGLTILECVLHVFPGGKGRD